MQHIPTAPATIVGQYPGLAVIRVAPCPYCHDAHIHGWPEGETEIMRAADCRGGGSYIVRLEEG